MTASLREATRREVEDLRALVRRPRARADEDVVVLEGRRLVSDAIDRGLRVEQILFDQDRLAADERLAELATRAQDHGVSCRRAPSARFARCSTLHNPPGILAVARRPHFDLGAVLARDVIFAVAALGVQDPTNLGALARNALAFAVDALLCTPDGADPFGPKVVRASAGAILALPVFPLAPAKIAALCREHRLALLAADPRATTDLDEVPPTPRALLSIGAEGAGLPEEIAAAARTRFRIPTTAAVESLNLTSAAAIALYRLAPRRGRPST